MSETVTQVGYEWWCNACPFHTHVADEAAAHARERASYPHMLYELVARTDKPPPFGTRYVYANEHGQVRVGKRRPWWRERS